MKKNEKNELLKKDLFNIEDEKIDELSRKFSKIIRTNNTKIISVALASIMVGGIVGAFINHNGIEQYKDKSYYDIYYIDQDENLVINPAVCEDEAPEDMVAVKSKWELIEDGYYERDIKKYTFDENIEQYVRDIVNKKVDINDLDLKIKNESQASECKIFENADSDELDEEITATYKKFKSIKKVEMPKDDKISLAFSSILPFVCEELLLLFAGRKRYEKIKEETKIAKEKKAYLKNRKRHTS